jgi:hypothetical protein
MAPTTTQRYPIAEYGDPHLFVAAGSFETNDTAAPTLVRGRYIDSVVRTSAGLFQVQLQKPYPQQIIAGVASPDLPAAAGSGTACIAGVDCQAYNKTTGIVQLRAYSASTSATAAVIDDPPVDARISFVLFCQSKDRLIQP